MVTAKKKVLEKEMIEKVEEEVVEKPVVMKAEVVEEVKPEVVDTTTLSPEALKELTTPSQAMPVAPEVTTPPVQVTPPATQVGGQAGSAGVNYDSSMGGLDASVPLEKKNRKMFAIGIVLLVIVLSGLGWLLYQRVQLPPVTQEEEVVEVQVSDQDAVISEQVEEVVEDEVVGLERDEIMIEVMNGSGVTGAAGKVASTLEELGYTMGEIGNADDTVGHELYVQEELEEQLETLLADMEEELGITEITGYLEDGEVMARVILGE